MRKDHAGVHAAAMVAHHLAARQPTHNLGKQVEVAAKLARRAIRLRHTLRPAWLLLARCYVRLGLYSLALITLNVAPTPPLPGPELVGHGLACVSSACSRHLRGPAGGLGCYAS